MYVTKADMIARFTEVKLVEVTDRADPPTDAIVDAVLDKAIADAGDMIDSYIGRRYTLPLSSIPSVLSRHAAIIAFYYLTGEIHSDQMRKEFEDSKSWLTDVSTGKAVLDAAGIIPASAPAEAVVDAPPRMFSRTSMGDF